MSRSNVAALALLGLLACDTPPTLVPLPPIAQPPPDVVVPPPEPQDPGVDFSWDNVRGILIFPGTQASGGEIESLHRMLRERWPGKTITYNVCSETFGWGPQGAPWPAGPAPFSVKNLDNLRRFLSTTADVGGQVKLNIFCTMRDNASWMAANARRYATEIGTIASDYNHVTVSIANEYYHTASALRDGSRLRELRNAVRQAGFGGLIGTDDNIGCPGCSVVYNPALRALGFLPDFHPYRSPNPSRKALARIARENGVPTVISEPVAYSTSREGRCCTSSRAEIKRYMCDAEAEGLVWFFHSTDGLGWPAFGGFDWLPGGVCR